MCCEQQSCVVNRHCDTMSHAVLFCGRELGTRKAAYGLDLYCVAPLLSQCRRCCRKCASGVQLCLRWPGQCQGSARRGGRPGTGATKLCCSLLYCRIDMQALLQGGAAAGCSLLQSGAAIASGSLFRGLLRRAALHCFCFNRRRCCRKCASGAQLSPRWPGLLQGRLQAWLPLWARRTAS